MVFLCIVTRGRREKSSVPAIATCLPSTQHFYLDASRNRLVGRRLKTSHGFLSADLIRPCWCFIKAIRPTSSVLRIAAVISLGMILIDKIVTNVSDSLMKGLLAFRMFSTFQVIAWLFAVVDRLSRWCLFWSGSSIGFCKSERHLWFAKVHPGWGKFRSCAGFLVMPISPPSPFNLLSTCCRAWSHPIAVNAIWLFRATQDDDRNSLTRGFFSFKSSMET